MSGPIVAAVTRAIEEGSGEYWYIGVRAGTSHGFFVDYCQCIDRFDAMIFRRLARGLPSILAGMTMVEREDGTMRPWLIDDPAWYEDRRKGVRKGIEFRRSVARAIADVAATGPSSTDQMATKRKSDRLGKIVGSLTTSAT